MRILELITLGEIGGAQTVLVDLLNGISEKDLDVTVDVAFGSGSFLPDALGNWSRGRIIQIPWLNRNIHLANDLKAFFEISKICKSGNYDMVHCHSSKASWLARVIARQVGIPRVAMTVHGLSFHNGNSVLSRAIYKNIEKCALPMATDYIFVSKSDLKIYEQLGLESYKTVLIPNGRPVPPKPGVKLKKLLGIPEEAPVVCMAARLAEVKNPLAFIRIAKMVSQQYSSTSAADHPRFVLIGDGPLFNSCGELIGKENLADWVYLSGHKDDASQYFWDADIVMLTSRYEACPLVVIEAMAAGIPVVATNVGGTGNLVTHGKTGYLYSEDNEIEAANQVLRLLKDRELWQKMSLNSSNVYHLNYTVEQMVDKYIRHFGLTGAKING